MFTYLQQLTFPLALTAYASMVLAILISKRDCPPRILAMATAGFVTIHVLLVWTFRYEWQLSQATRNGYLGFAIFHSALVLIAISAIAPRRASAILARAAFVIVTIGAIGAVFRYDEVAAYQIPVIGVALVGGCGLISVWRPSTAD